MRVVSRGDTHKRTDGADTASGLDTGAAGIDPRGWKRKGLHRGGGGSLELLFQTRPLQGSRDGDLRRADGGRGARWGTPTPPPTAVIPLLQMDGTMGAITTCEMFSGLPLDPAATMILKRLERRRLFRAAFPASSRALFSTPAEARGAGRRGTGSGRWGGTSRQGPRGQGPRPARPSVWHTSGHRSVGGRPRGIPRKGESDVMRQRLYHRADRRCAGIEPPPPGLLLSRGEGGGGGGFGPKTWCTKNGLTRFSLLQISFFPTMVTLVWGGGEGVLGEGSPSPWFLIILKKPCPPPPV